MTERPRDHRGRLVPLGCPSAACGNGRLQYEGDHIWRCNGLADPGHPNLPLIECPHSHYNGTKFRRTP